MLQKKILLNDLYKHNSYVIDDVTAFLIGWHQIFAGINYRIDAVKQFVHVETIYLVD